MLKLDCHYSTQPFLAWCFNHYFYGAEHWTYVAQPFHPFRLANPRSSNPLRIFETLYETWLDKDTYGDSILQKRINIKKGVLANENTMTAHQAAKLKYICDFVDIVFFYPFVYRVNVLQIAPATRLTKAGSGLQGSSEYLIKDLCEPEFEILFADFNTDADFNLLFDGKLSAPKALALLESRC